MIKMLAAITGAAMLTAAPAGAVVYQFDYTGTGFYGSYQASLLLDVPVDGGPVASISGIRAGIPVTGLSDYAGGDNVFSSGFSYVSFSGLSFATGNGIDYNVFYDGTKLYELNSFTNPEGDPLTNSYLTSWSVKLASDGGTPGGGSPSAVPEAATWMTMLAGFALLGSAMRRHGPQGRFAAI